jgi:tetratricopeptide (TPR) repeat protein
MPKNNKPRGNTMTFLEKIIGSFIAGRDIIINNFPIGQEGRKSQELRERNFLLDKVDELIIGAIKSALYHGKRIQLGWSENSAPITVVPFDNVPERMPPGASSFEAFDRSHQSLLILGGPGSGKTTTLLDIAKSAVDHAKNYVTLPIPAIFNLSSWNGSNLEKWLIHELTTQYSISRNIARQWVVDNNLILFLDGLDELRPEYRSDCVEAINALRQKIVFPMAICSRTQEYRDLHVTLRLDREMVLLAPEPEQIDNFLRDERLAGLRIALQTSTPPEALSPLNLNIMAQVYEGLPADKVEEDLRSADNRETRLFRGYLDKMFRQHRSTDFERSQTVHWLSWLAIKRVEPMEQLQPAYLEKGAERWSYNFLSSLAGLFILTICNSLSQDDLNLSMRGSILVFLVQGTLLGWISHLRLGQGANRKTPTWYWSRTFLYCLSMCIATFLTSALVISDPFKNELLPKLIGQSVLAGLAFAFVFRWQRSPDADIQLAETIGWSRTRMAKGFLLGALLGSLSGILACYAFKGVAWSFISVASVVLALAVPFGIFGALGAGVYNKKREENRPPIKAVLSSLLHAVQWGLAPGGLIGLLFWALLALDMDLHHSFVAGLAQAFELWVGIGAFFFLSGGGFDVIKHFLLRFILYRNNHIPWKYFLFLHYASHLTFIRQDGNRYMFTVPFFQEQLADWNQGRTKSTQHASQDLTFLQALRRVSSFRINPPSGAISLQWIPTLLLLLSAIAIANTPSILHTRRAWRWYNTAQENFGQKHWNEAIKLYRRSLSNDPNFQLSWFGLERTYFARGIESGSLEDFQSAVESLERGHISEKLFSEAYAARGLALARRGDLKQGLRDLNKAVSLNTTNPLNRQWRGLVYHRQSMAYKKSGLERLMNESIRQAAIDYDRALELSSYDPQTDPRSKMWWFGFFKLSSDPTNCSLRPEGFTQKIEALSSDPSSLKVLGHLYAGRGTAYADSGDFNKALQDLNEAIRLDPNKPLYWQWRGLIYHRRAFQLKASKSAEEPLAKAKNSLRRAIDDYVEAVKIGVDPSEEAFNPHADRSAFCKQTSPLSAP